MVTGNTIKIGTRGSTLALLQTNMVLNKLRQYNPGINFEIIKVRTYGDINSTGSLQGMGVGVFVKEIERQLLDKTIDMAVHSLKDLPTELPDGLHVNAVLERQDPRDIQTNILGSSLAYLPEGFTLGTSSPRRISQIKSYYPKLNIVPLRGNIETRLEKSSGIECNGAVLAAAGLIRLNLVSKITEYLSPTQFVPPPGQGVIAVETRTDDSNIATYLKHLDHYNTRSSITTERLFLQKLGGGCQTPMGAYAEIVDSDLKCTVFLGSPDGKKTFTQSVAGPLEDPHAIALRAHELLISEGAGELLQYDED